VISPTRRRVEEHTDRAINERIRRQTESNVVYFAREGRDRIDQRLADLDWEWDMERTLEANAASITLLGLGLGVLVDRRFFVLPAVVATFLLQHAIQGWCPPVPVFRRLGFRTATEIDQERYALKAVRGDFERLQPEHGYVGETEARHILDSVSG
jgi:hypothetical protein